MASPPPTAKALSTLHYIAPIAVTLYFLSTKTVAACLLQQPLKSSKSQARRTANILLQVVTTGSVVAEAVTTIIQAVRDSTFVAPQHYIIYLTIFFAIHSCLTLGLLDNQHPLWHPYLGAWLVAVAFEIPIIVLQGLKIPDDDFAKARAAFCVLRAITLTASTILASYCILCDRHRSIRLDDESEALLAANIGEQLSNNALNGHAKKHSSSPHDSVLADETGIKDGSDDDADGCDSGSEEPEQDEAVRAQQKQRLQQSGSWLAYLKEFKIFIPMLLPRKNRLVQSCLAIMGVMVCAERALSILLPRQFGIVVEKLTKAYVDDSGTTPWPAIGLWMLFTIIDSQCGIALIKLIVQMPVDQYGHRMIATTAFGHIMDLSMDFHDGKNTGELIRIVEQGRGLQDLLGFVLFDVGPMFFDLVVALFYVSILFDVYMSMILFGIGVGYVWIGAKMTVSSIKQRRQYNAASLNQSRVQNEAINNWQTVSHFNRGKYESMRYDQTVSAYNLAELRHLITWNLGGSAQSFVMLTGRLAAMSLAAYRVSQGRATIGNFVTLSIYWQSIEFPIANVSCSMRRLSKMLTDSERLLQLLTTKPSIVDAPEAQDMVVKKGAVTFDHVEFSYDPRKSTLKDVNFEVKPGQTIALVGETGGGKSTVLKLLYRYYDISKGSIRIDDQDIRDVTLDSLRNSFGWVPQDPALFNDSIMENIKYARSEASDEEVKEACRAAAIHDKIESFPNGYKTKVGERGVKLSGGELQRVAIARAILRKPKIVLLDEATSMIDAETEATIQAAFKELTYNRTTFIVAHRLSTIQHADQILVINDGRVIERGTHEELIKQKGKYVSLWSMQLSKDVKDVGTTLDVQKKDEVLKTIESDTAQVRVQDVVAASATDSSHASSNESSGKDGRGAG